jgi:hypothetical protein
MFVKGSRSGSAQIITDQEPGGPETVYSGSVTLPVPGTKIQVTVPGGRLEQHGSGWPKNSLLRIQTTACTWYQDLSCTWRRTRAAWIRIRQAQKQSIPDPEHCLYLVPKFKLYLAADSSSMTAGTKWILWCWPGGSGGSPPFFLWLYSRSRCAHFFSC